MLPVPVRLGKYLPAVPLKIAEQDGKMLSRGVKITEGLIGDWFPGNGILCSPQNDVVEAIFRAGRGHPPCLATPRAP